MRGSIHPVEPCRPGSTSPRILAVQREAKYGLARAAGECGQKRLAARDVAVLPAIVAQQEKELAEAALGRRLTWRCGRCRSGLAGDNGRSVSTWLPGWRCPMRQSFAARRWKCSSPSRRDAHQLAFAEAGADAAQ